MGTERGNWHLELPYDQWVALSVSGPWPLARYKHAAAVVDEKLYISGGSRDGRYLSDIQVFDHKTLAWFTVNLNTKLNADKTKDNPLQEVFLSSSVRFIDLESYHIGVMETSGKVPVARGGQSVTMVGSRVIMFVMFGGEDKHRLLLNDVHVLDLETLTWDV
ncbi:Galactose oxidase/kelch repeat superfamily protein [Actinidia rufa]|uniref:Galactose oxidase/kelch repeat superfamily protein n=1 Tax=Actinidia rufa TaxID=165716 RepID=A0A7J0GV69_9ERIC|nr:Galactose oxidase/kelch repeat superfamily protein [Actinidia rufa]